MKQGKRNAIYAGTFDPFTLGHLDIVKRAALIFDHITIAVSAGTTKSSIFPANERLKMVKSSVGNISNVNAELFSGLIVDFARLKNVNILVRGLRGISDFDIEYQMAVTNSKLTTGRIETVFFTSSEKYAFTSSTLVREIFKNGGDISEFVPRAVLRGLKKI